MSIQEDLEIEKTGNVVELVGFVNKGVEGNMCTTLREGQKVQKLGNHALQLVFIGMTGFRFPFAHFITDQVQGYDLHTIFWEAVDALQMYGFTCTFTCMDGASSNRVFVNINLVDHSNMIVQNPCNLQCNVVFMMDYSHVAKKIRNNIMKSGTRKGCTRQLCFANGDKVLWEMFIHCYEWDQQNALQVNRFLTHEHIYPSTQSKMRNQLAEDVLNSEMLHMFKQYQASLKNGAVLNGVISLLRQTSKMVRVFRDFHPIRSLDDERLTELQEVLSFFKEWRNSMSSKDLMSYQCLDDIEYCILGFIQLCTSCIEQDDVNITPSIINSDAVENFFCQQRSTYNGANTNPTALQYQRNINSILLGQSTISRKSNAFGNNQTAESFAYSKSGATEENTKNTGWHCIKENQGHQMLNLRSLYCNKVLQPTFCIPILMPENGRIFNDKAFFLPTA